MHFLKIRAVLHKLCDVLPQEGDDMKEQYQKARLEIICFETEDIISASSLNSMNKRDDPFLDKYETLPVD